MSLTRAYSLTEITSLQPLEFVKLPLAAVLAWLIFSEVPGVWTWLGGIIIFTSTVYITHREVQVAKSSQPNHGYRESKF
jgi:drug/metabolite transporter (DMT)-like permease